MLWSTVSTLEIGVPSNDEEREFVVESSDEETKAGTSSSCLAAAATAASATYAVRVEEQAGYRKTIQRIVVRHPPQNLTLTWTLTWKR